MRKLINKLARGQRGFTLIELVVVIAILGVLAAIAVPLVTNYLGSAKEQAYTADKKRIQAAVDAYYTDLRNVQFLGARQYPIKGMDSTGSLNIWTAGDSSTTLPTPLNPFKGTRGDNPKWRDGGDGIRNEENLNAELQSLTPTGTAGWYVVKVTRQGVEYVVDSRDYLIDFTKLTVDDPAAGKLKLLDKVPSSASTDNSGGAATGSYSWYVDADGKVNSVYFHFPTNSLPPAPAGPDNRGFVSGVYP